MRNETVALASPSQVGRVVWVAGAKIPFLSSCHKARPQFSFLAYVHGPAFKCSTSRRMDRKGGAEEILGPGCKTSCGAFSPSPRSLFAWLELETGRDRKTLAEQRAWDQWRIYLTRVKRRHVRYFLVPWGYRYKTSPIRSNSKDMGALLTKFKCHFPARQLLLLDSFFYIFHIIPSYIFHIQRNVEYVCSWLITL